MIKEGGLYIPVLLHKWGWDWRSLYQLYFLFMAFFNTEIMTIVMILSYYGSSYVYM